MRGFLGLTGYYRKFNKDYRKVAKPLTVLTMKDNFHWDLAAQESFEALKKLMTSSSVLAHPNFTQPFEVECNATGRGIRAVVMQQKHPIAYFSKALSERRSSKSAYDKEIMALTLAFQH